MQIRNSEWVDDINHLMMLYEQACPATPILPDQTVQQLRLDLIQEEVQELLEAHEQQDLRAIFDGIIDILVVTIGAGIAYGLPMDAGWDEVMRSNFSKVGENGKINKRKDGKVLKPDTYSPPNLEKLINPPSRYCRK